MTASPRLADHTTIRLGGPAREFRRCHSEDELVAAIAAADADSEPLLVLGGGSNLLVADEGFDGLVLQDGRAEIRVDEVHACAGASVTVSAGYPWDDFVARAVSEGWVGIEALSGIPGSTGATPVQNVGAYGQEVAETIASVRVFDRELGRRRRLAVAELEFSYRDSLLKRSLTTGYHPTPRYVVLDVTFQFRLGELSAPIRFGEVSRRLGLTDGERAPLADVRAAVLEVRRGKGMVLDPNDHDTWSAGSFFTNPILATADADRLPAEAPRWDAGPGLVKTSAAWLIDHAGFHKGFNLPGPAALSTKHALALTNRGSATTTDIVALARTVRDGVAARFGVRLVPEPVFVSVAL